MKSYIEIKADIKNAREELKQSEACEKRLQDKWIYIDDRLQRREEFKAIEDDIVVAETKSRDIRIALHIMRNNARIALFHEVFPVVLEVLKKYKGKPYGDKTREKIMREVEDLTGCRAYISTKYNQDEVNIFPVDGTGNDYTITVGLKYDEGTKGFGRLLIDNKIQVLPFERFDVWYIKNKYIEDIPAAVDDMKRLHKQALSMQNEIKGICCKFNSYAVEGIDSIYADRPIHNNIITR